MVVEWVGSDDYGGDDDDKWPRGADVWSQWLQFLTYLKTSDFVEKILLNKSDFKKYTTNSSSSVSFCVESFQCMLSMWQVSSS